MGHPMWVQHALAQQGQLALAQHAQAQQALSSL